MLSDMELLALKECATDAGAWPNDVLRKVCPKSLLRRTYCKEASLKMHTYNTLVYKAFANLEKKGLIRRNPNKGCTFIITDKGRLAI